jgi:hypothetical protein
LDGGEERSNDCEDRNDRLSVHWRFQSWR